MEEIREAALACYEHLSDQDKQTAVDSFNALAKSKKGKVSLREYAEYFKKTVFSEIASPEFFKALDTDGNGTLDFNEYITVYYLLISGRVKFCQECRAFLKGLYFSCYQCFNSTKETYDLCCVCYHKKNIDHHGDAIFLDNYTLLTSKRKENIPASQGSAANQASAANNKASAANNKASANKNSEAKRPENIQLAMLGLGVTGLAVNAAGQLWKPAHEALPGSSSSSETISTVGSAGNIGVDSVASASTGAGSVDSTGQMIDAASSCNVM